MSFVFLFVLCCGAILKNVIITVQPVTIITWAGLTNQIARNVIVTSKFILINNIQPFEHSVWKMADSICYNKLQYVASVGSGSVTTSGTSVHYERPLLETSNLFV